MKNEAAMLQGFIDTHRDEVDEVVVVDTGSSDDGPQIARSLGARVESITWPESFAEARNRAISRCTGDWILMLDADERLEPQDLREMRPLLRSDAREVWTLIQRTYCDDPEQLDWQPCDQISRSRSQAMGYYDVRLVRCFPRDPSLVFEGIIHERLKPSALRAGFVVRDSQSVIHHLRAEQSLSRQAEKNVLYLTLSREKYRQHPNCPQAGLELAAIAMNSGCLEEARDVLLPLFLQHPDHLNLVRHFGVVLVRMKQWDSVVEYLKPCISRMSCGKSTLQELVGLAETKRENYREAISLLRDVVQNQPFAYRAYVNLGVAYVEIGEFSAAITMLSRASELHPHTDLPLVNLAWCYRRMGKPQWAEPVLMKALELNPSRWQSYVECSLLAFERGAYQEAVKYASLAKQIPECGAQAYIRAGAAAMALGDEQDALENLRQAVQIDASYQYLLSQLSDTKTSSSWCRTAELT
ncbi:MAG: glycosyltransferase [Myxococcales bacterium]|nr:glycosyltransferase [Myxococcales bacterium]